MQDKSNAYKAKFESGDYEVVYKFRMNDNPALEYTDDYILGGRITEAEFSAFSFGNFVSRALELSFLDDEVFVPKMAKIDVSYTIGEADNSWSPKGTFYVDKRQRSDAEISLIAYDAALKAGVPFMTSGTWTITSALDVYDELVSLIGVGADSTTRNMIQANNYTLESAPDIGQDGTTIGEMIGYLAAVYGCNAVIDEFENLKFIKPYGTVVGTYQCSDISASPVVTIDRIKLHTDRDVNAEFRYPVVSDEEWDAMTGYILEGTSIFATQTMANAIGAELVGKTYRGFTATGVIEDPALQLGDIITLEDSDVMLVKRIISFDDDAVELSAPYEEEIESEYPKPTPTQRQIQKEKARRMASISVLEDQIELKVNTADFEAADASNYASITPYYLQNYGATPSKTDPNWSTTAPQWVSGMHMWTLTEYVTKGGTVTRSNPVDITGATGPAGQGEAGKSPVSFDQYLYASTSSDSPTGGQWIPVEDFDLSDYSGDQGNVYYIWTKTITTFDDSSTTETEPYLDTYYNNVQAELQVLDGSIRSYVAEQRTQITTDITNTENRLQGDINTERTRIDTLSSQLTQTAGELRGEITNQTELLENYADTAASGAANDLAATLATYIRYYQSGGTGVLELGDNASGYVAKLNNQKLSFYDGDTEVAYISNNKLYITNGEIQNNLQIGKYQWITDSTGRMSLKWVG